MNFHFKTEVYESHPYRAAGIVLLGGLLLVPLLLSLDYFSSNKDGIGHGDSASLWKPSRRIEQVHRFLASVRNSKKRHVILASKIPVSSNPVDLNVMHLNRNNLRSYNYIFEGKATYQGVPCPNASVLVRISTPYGNQTKGTTTDKDGSYQLSVPVQALANDLLQWSVEAYTPEFQKVELLGSKIVTEDDTVSIENSLAFLANE
jgi:hypothetical protein